MMNILVCNDDGYQAVGIQKLARVAAQFGTVRVVAPERDRSAVSNSLTLDRPLRIRQADNGFYYVNGTPTDCVHLALCVMQDFVPDLIVSGINHGANMGDDTLYSGTVAAATEGFFLGIPGIAFSLNDKSGRHYDTAAAVAATILKRVCTQMRGQQFLWSVNIPALHISAITGIEVVRLGRRHHAQNIMPTQNPRGEELYWIGAAGDAADKENGTDFAAVEAGKVTITPLTVDLTAYAQLDATRDALAGLSAASFETAP